MSAAVYRALHIGRWEAYHQDKIALATAVLTVGASLTAVAQARGCSLSVVSNAVQAVCQRRNPEVYYGEVIAQLRSNEFYLYAQPSLAFLRAHRHEFGFGEVP